MNDNPTMGHDPVEPALSADPPCEGCGADDFRCARSATCPDYRNPAAPAAERIRATLDDLHAISAAIREALAALAVDSDSPVPDETFRDAVRRGLALLTYLGVGAYVLAVLYLSAYYGRVVPGLAVSYPYVETVGAVLGSGVLLLLLTALGPATGFLSAALGVSRTTRELLHNILNQIVEAHVGIARAEAAISELGRFLAGAATTLNDDAETEDVCHSLTEMTVEQRDVLREQTALVAKVVSSMPLITRAPILLARRARLHPWVLTSAIILSAVAALLPLLAAAFSASSSSGAIYLLLRVGAVLLALFAGVLFWLLGTTFDLVVGPRTRMARGGAALLTATLAVILLGLVVQLGSAAGVHDIRFPAGSLALVSAETDAGKVFSGYAIPVLGSTDVFVLSVGPGNAEPTITRIPAATLRSTTTTTSP